MVKYSILMTVYDREPEMLMATLRTLRLCDLRDTELIVVNDHSHMMYGWVESYLREYFDAASWIDMPPYEAYRFRGGANNPARAFNTAVLNSVGENLVLMSSDVLVPQRTFNQLRRVDLSTKIWTPYVEDTNSQSEYCGPRRLFPAPWFLGCKRDHLIEVGGWDETYLQGISYEDNDVVGRLALRAGGFMGDWSVKVYHQGHNQFAYDHNDPEIYGKTMLNREYTMKKWGGIPFDSEFTPFDVARRMDKSGNPVHICTAKPGKLDTVIGATKGLVREKGGQDANGE